MAACTLGFRSLFRLGCSSFSRSFSRAFPYSLRNEPEMKSKERTGRLSFRSLQTTPRRRHGEYEWQDPKSEEEVVNITYIDKEGKSHPIKGKVGDNIMYLAHRYAIEMEGACEASLACTTCHVYVEAGYYDRLQPPEEKEEDLLDMAPFLRENSRLGCQIILSKDLEGIVVRLPKATRNFYVDGHVPAPH